MTEAKTCNTCTREFGAPYRAYDAQGKVVQGCVDECHTGHLVPCSESNFWHNRKEAKAVRASMKKFFSKR